MAVENLQESFSLRFTNETRWMNPHVTLMFQYILRSHYLGQQSQTISENSILQPFTNHTIAFWKIFLNFLQIGCRLIRQVNKYGIGRIRATENAEYITGQTHMSIMSDKQPMIGISSRLCRSTCFDAQNPKSPYKCQSNT